MNARLSRITIDLDARPEPIISLVLVPIGMSSVILGETTIGKNHLDAMRDSALRLAKEFRK